MNELDLHLGKPRRYTASASLFLLALSSAPAQSDPAARVEEAQRRLLQLTVPDSMETDVPLPIRDSIVELKRALATQTDAVVLRLSPAATAAAAKQQLAEALPPPTVGKIPDDQWRKWMESESKAPIAGLYGGGLTLSIKKPLPSLLVVQENFGIACGSDNVLLVYSNAGGSWKRILLWQSRPYTSVGEAFGDTYETLLLRPTHNGHPLLLVLHGTPWCTSTMSGFSMDVFELGGSSNSTPLWHGNHDYRRLDLDPPLTLRSTTDGFEVRTSVGVWSDGGKRIVRMGLMRYALGIRGIHRVEPLAINARETVEEWLQMPRPEAVEFADGPADSLTWTMYQEFTNVGKADVMDVPLADVGSVRACKNNPSHFQVDVTSTVLAIGVPDGRPGPAYFVQLRRVPNGYRIHAVTRTKDPSCTGPDLMSPP